MFFYCLSNSAHATVRRVGFIATIQPVNGFDYNNFQAAHDASVAGDTIQLYSSTAGSANYTGTISKAVVIIGSGYFTNSYSISGSEIANTNIQNMPGVISGCTFSIDNGSAGTIIQSINGLTITTVNQVNALNNITISRCRNVNISFTNSGNCDNWKIAQCYGVTMVQSSPGSGFTGNRTITKMSISNSVIFAGITFSTSPTGTYTGNTIYNCNFLSGSSLSLSGAFFTIQNCIFETQSFTAVNNVTFIKNLTTSSAASNPISTNAGGSGNVFGVSLASIFNGYPTNTVVSGSNTYSNDGRFQLKTGGTNAAINGGFLPGTSTATDCGIFGGGSSAAYVLSGLPAIPVYYQLSSPSAITTSGTYNINFSVKSNN